MRERLPTASAEALFAESLTTLVTGRVAGLVATPAYGRRDDLGEHLAMCEAEFVGRSRLLFYHAVLNVLLRRAIDVEESRRRFLELWCTHAEVLLEQLDSRWLVSAADSFADHGRDAGERALGLAASLLANTIKLHETERQATGGRDPEPDYERLRGRVTLDDGMTAFVVGHGDMVHNLEARLLRAAAQGGPAGRLLETLFLRVNRHDSVYRRFGRVHRNPATGWAGHCAAPDAARAGGAAS